MTFEDDLRSVMKDHDRDAPSGLRFDPSRRTRTRLWAPLAAAAAIVLLAAGLMVVLGGEKNDAAGGLSCPRRYEGGGGVLSASVPRTPTVDGATDGLVPDRLPSRVVVCAFTHTGEPWRKQSDPVRLDRARRIVGDLAPIQKFLHDRPAKTGDGPLCPAYLAATDADNYLIELRYGDDVVWIAAPGDHCAGSTNGVFESATNLRTYAVRMLRTGHAPPSR